MDAAPPALTLLPRSGPTTAEQLATLRGRSASVVVWGLHCDHRQVVVTDGSYDRVRAEARAAARAAGVPIHGTLSDVAPAGPIEEGARRRVVVLATAPSGEVTAALRPLRDAGIKVASVRTPASALVSLSRLRAVGAPGALHAHVAIGETTTTVALMHGGFLRFARDFNWGALDEASGYREPVPSDEVGARLAADLGGFVDACGTDISAFEQIVLTGAVSELRSVAIRLTQQFDVEVEPLDYAGGLDLDGLAASIDAAGVRYADVWLAWAAAADDKPLIDLYRDRRIFVRKQMVARAAVAAGVVLGVGVGWAFQDRISTFDLFGGGIRQSTPVAAATPIPPANARTVPSPAAPERATVPAQPTAVSAPTPAAVPSGEARALSVPPSPNVAAAVRSQESAASAAPSVAPAVAVAPPPMESRRALAVPPPRPSTAQPPPLPPPRVSAPTRASVSPPNAVANTPVVAGQSRPEGSALPFEAVLGTILYGPDRKLAVVDDRIVQVGDDVRGAVVVEITPTSVMLRDPQGRLRRLTLGAGRR